MKSALLRYAKSTPALIAFFVILTLGAFAASYTINNSPKAAAGSVCTGNCVALNKDKAVPDTLTITPGEYVQFNSADGRSHSLSIGAGGDEHSHTGSFSSGTFKADEGWRVQFKDEGSFLFHDHMNPKINVLVVVYTPGKTYKVE